MQCIQVCHCSVLVCAQKYVQMSVTLRQLLGSPCTCSLSLSLSHTHTLFLSLARSLALSHTHRVQHVRRKGRQAAAAEAMRAQMRTGEGVEAGVGLKMRMLKWWRSCANNCGRWGQLLKPKETGCLLECTRSAFLEPVESSVFFSALGERQAGEVRTFEQYYVYTKRGLIC